MVVGLVLVSHSSKLAEGAAELAREMAGPDVPIEPAGGLDEPGALGTDATRVLAAIERADRGDGVLVLMDLGSAVLSAELALDLVGERRDGVRLTAAPLVEGAVAAAVAARLGSSLDEVEAEALGGLQAKVAHLGGEEATELVAAAVEGGLELRLTLPNRLGLHARPAARFVQTVGRFDAEVSVTNLANGRGPASGRSLNAIATLGGRQGHELLVRARGPEAEQALAALEQLAGTNLGDVDEAPTEKPASNKVLLAPGELAGLPGAPGLAVGPARRLHAPPLAIPTEPAADREAEAARLLEALARVSEEIRATRRAVAARAGESSAEIFDAHRLYLEDEALLDPARRAILDEGQNAAAAWNAASEALASEYRGLEDEYQRERAADVLAVARQVVADLTCASASQVTLDGPGIVVAADLTPAETAALDGELVLGIATAHGGPTSHSAILARSLGLPAVVGLGEAILAVPEETELLLDGDGGGVRLEPDPGLVAEVAERRRRLAETAATALAAAREPAVTRDGRRIEVFANVGSPDDVAVAVANGAEGVGLLRTEFVFLGRDTLPDEDEQVAAYRAITAGLGGRPLILRTLDVGADKPLPFLPRPPEANPFLGVRGIRLSLAEPELLDTQLRAALRVAADFPVKVMFPMVATLDELRRAREAVGAARKALATAGTPHGELLEVGVMVEVPAVALSADAFAAEADFLSIGTNDLAQYTLAAERGNAAVAGLADGLHPAVLRLIGLCGRAAEARGSWVGVCGELASDPAAAVVLVGLGVTELSASPPSVPAVKQAVRAIDTASARSLAEEAQTLESAAAVRELLASVKLLS